METILFACVLAGIGLITALAGYALFRLVLPLVAFVIGFGAGFSGVQALFGSNVWSYGVALITALIVGLIFGLVAFFYYTIGVMVVVATFSAGVLAYMGQAVGLLEDGFIVFLLSLAGAIMGGLVVLKYGLQHSLIVWVTSVIGVGAILSSMYLLFGDLTLAELHRDGILTSITTTVTSSWIWLFCLIGGAAIASSLQRALLLESLLGDRYVIKSDKR